jgi:cell division protein FtsI (penicillin-binding protein 3)
MAPLTKPSIVVVVTINGSAQFGGVAAAPVFSKVAGAALRILDVPKDLPDDLPEEKGAAPAVNDVAIAGLGELPDENEPGAFGPFALPVRPGSGADASLRVPDFRGMTLRNVLTLSSQSGLPVEFFGKGVVRSQQPPAGAVLPPGERVRVLFAR